MTLQEKLAAARTIANGTAKKQVSEPLTPQIKESMPGVDAMDVRSKLNAAREIARGTVQRGPSPTSTKTTPSVLDSPLLLPAKAALVGLTLSQKPMLDTAKLVQKPINAVVESVRRHEAEKREKQIKETQRLAKLDIGAAEKRVAELEIAAKAAKDAHTAVDADPQYTYWLDYGYNSKDEANEAYLAASNAAWEARKKIEDELTALKKDIEAAKPVQYAMIPTRDDFEVYAAKGAAMKNNVVMPVKRADDATVTALEVYEKLPIRKFPTSTDSKSIYDKLTDQEARIYNYLFAKDAERGTNYADEYLSFMMDPMTARRGRDQADIVKNSGLLRPVATVGYGLASGFDRAVRGISQNFSDTPLPAGELQYGAGYVRDDLADVWGPEIFGSNWAQIGFDLASTTGNMAPTIAASVAGGPAAGAAVTFASAGGNAYGEALARGYDQGSARAYGILAGASEAGLQYALGGISALGGKVVNSDGIQAALNNIKNAALRIPAKYAVAATGEMTEEYLQEILDPVFRNLALGENNEFKLFTEDAAYSALLAALSVGVLEGRNIVRTDVNLDRMGQTLRTQWGEDASGVTDVLIRMGLNQEQGTDAYQAAQAAQKRLGKGGTLTNVALGSLYQNVMGAVLAEGSMSAAGGGADRQLDLNITDNVATSDKRKIKQLVPATISQLKLFIKNAFQGKNTHQYIKIADVDPALADIVKQFGIDITGFSHVLKDNDIRHINKSHGEKSSDKYKVTIDMLANVQHVIDHYDTIYLGYDTKEGRQTIVYEKREGTRTFYVEEVLEEGGLSSKQMLVVGENSKPSFLKKYKKAINRTPDTDVAAFGRTTSDSSPGNHVQDAEDSVDLSDSIPQPPTGVNLRRSLPGSIPADIPPGLRDLYRLAQEMSTKPQPREIPQRPVQQSPQEILSQLAREITQNPDGPLGDMSNEDVKNILDEIIRRQSGESAPGEADISGEIERESDIGDAVRRTAKSVTQREKVVGFAKLPKEIRQSFCAGLENATPEAQKALQGIYQKADYVLGDGPRSYYAGGPLKNVVCIGKQASPSTVAHELFHQLDRQGKISQPLAESLMKDYLALNVTSGFDIKEYLMQEFPEAFVQAGPHEKYRFTEEYRGISDIFSGLTSGQIQFGFGHKKDYWKHPGTLEAEAWAQFGRVQFENQSGVLKMFQSLFPNFYESAIMALKELI